MTPGGEDAASGKRPRAMPRGNETKRQHHKAKNKNQKRNQAGRPFVSPRKTKHRGRTLVKKAELFFFLPKRGLPSQLPRGEQGGTQSPPLSAAVSTSSYHKQNEGGRLTVPTAGKSPTILPRPHPPQPDSYLSPSPVSSATVAKYSPPQTHRASGLSFWRRRGHRLRLHPRFSGHSGSGSIGRVVGAAAVLGSVGCVHGGVELPSAHHLLDVHLLLGVQLDKNARMTR